MIPTIILALVIATPSLAHTAAWARGMYCRGGITGDVQNTNLVTNPLYNLTKSEWFFQHDRGCDLKPPPLDEFLQLPAGGSFTVELAHNQAQTTMSYDGKFVSDWPDGKDHPEDWNAGTAGACLEDGAMHASNLSTTAGTAFAISYTPDLSKVTVENLVVFTVLPNTPWKREATYEVPAALPACPPGGCTCAWLWVPSGCGQLNIYMQGFKCNVTGATSTTPLAKARPPVMCADNPSKCVIGAKQMIAWNQLDGNNIVTSDPPGYNSKCGFSSGAQNDIFESSGETSPSPSTASAPKPKLEISPQTSAPMTFLTSVTPTPIAEGSTTTVASTIPTAGCQSS